MTNDEEKMKGSMYQDARVSRYVKRTTVTYLYRTVCGELFKKNKKKRESETTRDESNGAEEE